MRSVRYYCLCYRFWISFLDPGIFWMARKILIVEPYSKLTAAHKLSATFMKFLIMSKIEVIDKSASTYCFTSLYFLLLCWIYFRLEAFQQFPQPFLSFFILTKPIATCRKTHEVLKQYPAWVLHLISNLIIEQMENSCIQFSFMSADL